jgi:hypothetical protein
MSTSEAAAVASARASGLKDVNDSSQTHLVGCVAGIFWREASNPTYDLSLIKLVRIVWSGELNLT